MPLSPKLRWHYLRNRNRLVLLKMDVARRQKRGRGDAAHTLRHHKVDATGTKRVGWVIRRDSWPRSTRAPRHIRKPSLAHQRALNRQGVPF